MTLKCDVLYNRTNYDTRKKHVRKTKSDEYKYPLIHSTPKGGIRYMYSSVNTKGLFGIPKVIFGETGTYNSIIDMDGKYGMTPQSIGIKIDNEEEGRNIKNAIESEKFKDVLKSCSWGNYNIDHRLFTYFKKDFYNYLDIDK
jgi:hypothetical protein